MSPPLEQSPILERRRVPRRPCNQLATILMAGGERLHCVVRDTSIYGALVLVASAEDITDILTLETLKFKRPAHVVWRGGCRAGICFD
jgi:hypothetical protein